MQKVLALIATVITLAVVLAVLKFLPDENATPKPKGAGTSTAPISTAAAPDNGSNPAAKPEETVDTTGFVQQTAKQGAGRPAEKLDTVKMHYTGWTDGFYGHKKFDSSHDRGTPFTFKLGTGAVIKGWDLGVVGMKPGEVRMLTIPSTLGYGAAGSGEKIPPHATLYFEVEYVGLDETAK